MIDKLTTNFKHGWESGEHITSFDLRLDLEQAKLLSDGITISDVDKNQHYMLQVWDLNLFSGGSNPKWANETDQIIYPRVTYYTF